jgi:hypothetical protein
MNAAALARSARYRSIKTGSGEDTDVLEAKRLFAKDPSKFVLTVR